MSEESKEFIEYRRDLERQEEFRACRPARRPDPPRHRTNQVFERDPRDRD